MKKHVPHFKLQEVLCLGEPLVGMVYSCGSLLSELTGQEASPQQTDLTSRMFIRANLVCADKVETAYYSSGVFEDVCIHCGNPDGIIRGDYQLVRTVLKIKLNQRF